jgi:hypothetical protein
MTSEDVLYYNFVKEYLEEFFNYEDLVDKLSEKRADPLPTYSNRQPLIKFRKRASAGTAVRGCGPKNLVFCGARVLGCNHKQTERDGKPNISCYGCRHGQSLWRS